jgi:hypothetical protein
MKISVSIILTVILLPVGESAFAEKVKDVNVVSIPAVTVGNLPESQTVEGTVNIGNLPATQSVLVENEVTNPVPTEITNLEPIAVEIIGDNSNGQNGINLGPKKSSDLVTLIHVGDCSGVGIRRVFPDGTSEGAWRVPAESVLVATGFDWNGRFAAPGEIVEVRLQVFEPISGYSEAVFRDFARVGVNGNVGRASPVQNAVFGPGTIVCMFILGATPESATLRGFLAPDE